MHCLNFKYILRISCYTFSNRTASFYHFQVSLKMFLHNSPTPHHLDFWCSWQSNLDTYFTCYLNKSIFKFQNNQRHRHIKHHCNFILENSVGWMLPFHMLRTWTQNVLTICEEMLGLAPHSHFLTASVSSTLQTLWLSRIQQAPLERINHSSFPFNSVPLVNTGRWEAAYILLLPENELHYPLIIQAELSTSGEALCLPSTAKTGGRRASCSLKKPANS